MRLNATQTDMASALQHALHIITPQNTLPILSGVQLDAQDQTLRLTATDLTHHLTATIPCEVSEPGTIVLPAMPLAHLIQRLPTATFTLTTDAATGQATIRYGRNKAVLNGFGSETLPQFPTMPSDALTVSLPAGTLPTLQRQLVFACAQDETRPVLKGVNAHDSAPQIWTFAISFTRIRIGTSYQPY
ncbi:MAG: hypothetical protein C7B44_14880, partial [Sulfobacillus thermosulfidooxidans]